MALVDYSGRMAQVYDAGRSLPAASLDAWVEAAARHLGKGPLPLLDPGAGTGRFTASLARGLAADVVALEPAAGMRSQAVARGPLPGVRLVAGRAEAIPARTGAFRAVWASQVLHHVADLDACAAELRRVLRPGGRVLVRGMFGDCQWPLEPYFPEAVRLVLPGLDAFRRHLERAAFHEVAHEQIEQVIAATPADLYERTRLRADSVLARLDDPTFAQGLARLRADFDAERLAAPVTEILDLVVFE